MGEKNHIKKINGMIIVILYKISGINNEISFN